MMNKVTIPILILLAVVVQNCISPNDPEGIKILSEYSIDTNGYCRHIDACDSLIYITVDEHGLQFFTHNLEDGGVISAEESLTDLDAGQDVGERISLAENYNLAFALKYFEGVFYNPMNGLDGFIWINNYTSNTRDFVRDYTIHEDSENSAITIYTLNRSYEVGEQNTIHLIDFTQLTARYLNIIDLGDQILVDQATAIDSIAGLDINASEIAYVNGNIAVSNGQEGIMLFSHETDGSFVQKTTIETPGEVVGLSSKHSAVYAGLNHSLGCYSMILDPNGIPLDTFRFAEGYVINTIEITDTIIALACGNDGVLIYQNLSSESAINLEEIGWIDTAYAYDVDIYDDNTILVATREGVQIFRIEF